MVKIRLPCLFLCIMYTDALPIAPPVAWREVGLPNNDESASLKGRVRACESILVCEEGATLDECQKLVEMVSFVPDEESTTTTPRRRIPSRMAYTRAKAGGTPCDEPLSEAADELAQRILNRVMMSLDEQSHLSSLVKEYFGPLPMAELFRTDQLAFASREPAVNVYHKGGNFLPHTDGQSLTILIPLNVDFEGGGTAFWHCDDGPRVTPPASVVRPERPGSALVFGGNMMHAGLPVMRGVRVVLVASFSKRG